MGMTKFKLTFNDGETHEIQAKYNSPSFESNWWSYDPEGNEPYEHGNERKTLELGDTMYFNVETKGILEEAVLTLQLFDYDEALWIDAANPDDATFPTEEVHKTAQVRKVGDRYIATVKLVLEESWVEVVESDIDNTIDLYWQVRYGALNQYLPHEDTSYLQVVEIPQHSMSNPPERNIHFQRC